MTETSLIESFKQAMGTAGVELPAEIIPDGLLHRFATRGDKVGEKSGWFVLYTDEPAAGSCGNWRGNVSKTWCSQSSQNMTKTERTAYQTRLDAMRRQREEERHRVQAECRSWCSNAWKEAEDATSEHLYLKKKNVPALGLKNFKDSLIVPVQDITGTIHGLQFIGPDGSKKFKTGTSKGGHFFRIDGSGEEIIVCEGYATGASIHQATGHTVVIAFDAGNLRPVAKSIRSEYSDTKIVIAADDDHATKENTGTMKAKEAAKAIRGFLAVPVFPDTRRPKDTDFNDLARLAGMEAVRDCIGGAVAPTEETGTEPNPEKEEPEPDAEEKQKKESKTDRLIKLALAQIELFHDKDLNAYGTIQRDQHRETYPLKAKAFRICLSRLFWEQYQESVGSQVIQDVLGTLEGHAIHGGPRYPVYVRLAEYKGNIYVDLGNDHFEVVEITSDGWRILSNQNLVKFRRSSGMTALPYPRSGGRVDILRKYINLANPEDWPNLAGFIVMCFNPWGPYPVLSFAGEQGSAKSTGQKVIKALADPSTAPLRSLPKETRDLAIASKNSFILTFDNLSDIPGHMADALCRLATGAGFATRTLYSDEDETIIDAKRPILLNGIENVIRRHDLADRSIVINLAVISEDRRIPEADFWREFDDDAPAILGAFLDAVCCALRNYQSLKLPQLPRMADFAIWATAAEPALGLGGGSFLKSYSTNRREVIAMTLEADILGSAVKTFMETRGFEAWKGTATELLNALDDNADERTKKSKGWPRRANALSEQLKRSATALRADGIEVTAGKENGKRFISLEQARKTIVHIVPEIENKSQGYDITEEHKGTIQNQKIVPGSSTREKDRPRSGAGDDAEDDPAKTIVHGSNGKMSTNVNDYRCVDDEDDLDGVAPLLFKVKKSGMRMMP